MASIEARKGTTGKTSYRVKVRLRGHPAVSASFERLTDARKWATQTEAAIRERRYFRHAEAERHTFAEFIDRYRREVLPTKGSQAANQDYQFTWWRDQLGAYRLADVTPARIAECRDALASGTVQGGKRRSLSTVNRYLAALSHAYSVAVREWGWVDDNPCRKVRKPPEPRGRVRFLSDDERSRLIKACRASECASLYPVVLLALSTAARRGEILNLRWSDVNLNRRQIVLHETKNNERRVLPLAGPALEVVQSLSRVRRIDTDLLFPGTRPDRPVAIRKHWLKAVEAAGIKDFRFHDLRHSAASYLAMNGATLPELAAILGHKTLQMVKRYAHLSDDHVVGVVAAMNERFLNDATE